MVYILLITLWLIIVFAIFRAVEWVTKDYSQTEKDEVWKNILDGFNNYKQ